MALPLGNNGKVQLPLSTDYQWIVDQSGSKVKLACVNWPSNLEPEIPEGLDKQPVDDICNKILSMGFNCVRLTYPIYLLSETYAAATTVEKHFNSLGLTEAIVGIKAYNREFLQLSLAQAFTKVIETISRHNLMIILDNHISKPGWCCHEDDGNGFFGDKYFDPDIWRESINAISYLTRDNKNVVGYSLRNELRGRRENINVWEQHIREAVDVISKNNPDALIIISGFNFDLDLSVLHLPLGGVEPRNKIVFEIHQFAWSNGIQWNQGDPNENCKLFKGIFWEKAGFMLDRKQTLFLSQFGGDVTGKNEMDNKFLDCIFPYLVESDISWAWWGIQGSYYLREGTKDFDEVYGLLDKDWDAPRNPEFMKKLRAIQGLQSM